MNEFKNKINKAVKNQKKFIITPAKIAEYTNERLDAHNIKIEAYYIVDAKNMPALRFQMLHERYVYMTIEIEDLTEESIDFVLKSILNYGNTVMSL